MSKRFDLASLAAAPVETVPGSSRPTLTHPAPDQIAPTPLNPRRDFDPSRLTELGESMRGGQLQPVVGVLRAKYVKLFPEHADAIPKTIRIVMAAGERRWRAAMKVGLPTIDVHLREDIAESRVTFLAAVLTENVERSNFNYVEEARGLQQMLEMSQGSQAAAARNLNKSKGWFNQRIGLLRLSDEMQELVVAGELTALRDLRRYSALPQDAQLAAWKKDRERAERDEEGPDQDAETYTAVYAPAPSAPAQPPANNPDGHREQQGSPSTESAGEVSTATAAGDRPTLSPPSAPEPRPQGAAPPSAAEPASQVPESVPEPRGEQQPAEPDGAGDQRVVKKFPYDDGAEAAFFLETRMSEEEFAKMMVQLKAVEEKRAAAAS